jgi:hypothetical protein
MGSEVWVGLVTVVPGVDASLWSEEFGKAQGGVTWALAMAANESEFRESVGRLVVEEGWAAEGWEDVATFSKTFADEDAPEELQEARLEVMKSGEPQLTTFYLFRPPDFGADEGWVGQLDKTDFTPLQVEIAEDLQGMTQEVDLPLLLGVSAVEKDGAVEFLLYHSDEESPNLSIEVEGSSITVDYEYGHIHFRESDGDDWIDYALTFVSSALQGGAKIEMWDEDGEPVISRTLLLDDEGGWVEWSSAIYATSRQAKKAKRRPPDHTHVLSFLATG